MQKILNPSQYRSNGLSTLNKDNFTRVMVESINKVLNSTEGAVKEKHVRKLLIGSHQSESGGFFWQYLPVIRLKENQVICWKFCHVLHKMIRDGHKQVVSSSYERRQILLDCGNMWRHVEHGYGQLIFKYCTLLYNRINFLIQNPRFPNHLKLSNEQLDEIGERDPNVFFDLSCEIFDALDDIIKLQELVLLNMETKKYSSMTNAGKCHLAPLILCIQDSSLFYDYSVKILFKLHNSLPATTLEGHRERFNAQHKELKRFYLNTSNLQYFKTLIQIPYLSEKPPNFLIASDIQQHVAPQVVLISGYEGESPDQILVNLDDELQMDDLESEISADQQESLSSIQREDSIDTIFNQTNSDPFGASTSIQSEQETSMQLAAKDEKIQELELMVAKLRSELDAELEAHKQTKEASQSELKKMRSEMSNLRSQLNQMKNSYDAIIEERERAKHDSEISQVAMRKMVKEMSDLKSKQDNQVTIAKQIADAREDDLLLSEMNDIDEIIKEATRKIEELSEKSRRVEKGIKLQVNEKISEVCTNLMKAVRNLIIQARILQREIVGEDGKTQSAEFYKRNSSWTEGLISAANEVALAAKSLVEAADRSMSGKAKFSELAAAAHEVATATTQLVVASRVKANKDSEKLKNLTNAAKQVNQCSTNVVDASRVCAELIEQEVDQVDISALSLHQTKKLELETQVKLLELEKELSKERVKLGLLRRQHYEQEEAQDASTANQNQ